MNTIAVITAGGTGTRFGTVRPKQFSQLAGKMLIDHTIAAFDRHPLISDIVVVLPETEVSFFEKERQLTNKNLTLVTGGSTRQESVRRGIFGIKNPNRYVAIHDAARCLISQDEITATIQKCLDGWQGAICALPIRDTLKKVENEKIASTESRENLWGMQTPQVFEYELIKAAYEKAHKEKFVATDDAQVAEQYGAKICVVHGKSTNIKITYPEDLDFAEKIFLGRKDA